MSDGRLQTTLRALQARAASTDESRSEADLERNAAFWLTVRAGTNPAWSSLRRPFDLAHVDGARLGETPYLGALGFLVDARAILVPTGSPLHIALDRTMARAARTLERTGYADHPIVLAGLLLLAGRTAGRSHVETLRALVDDDTRRGPAEALILAAASEQPLRPITPDPTRTLDLACVVLGRRVLRDRAAGIFACDRSVDADHKLGELAAVRPPEEFDEFEAILTVAAIESMFGSSGVRRDAPEPARSAGRLTSLPRALIITAIPVEFAAVRALLRELREEQDPQGTIYEVGRTDRWEVCLAEFGPGNVSAAARTERALQFFGDDLQVAMFVGIAGGVKDVKLGDVVVATKVHAYEAGKDTEQGMLARPESDRSSYRLLERARAEARKPDWRRGLSDSPLPSVLLGSIAAGEKVVADRRSATAKFLRTRYSDVLAVEMEGAGFLRAADAHDAVGVLVVRGISDLLSGKAKADRAGSQERAARNAALFALGVLEVVAP